MKLKDKVALITGSSSGIGKAIALLFAEEGANVIICSNTSSEDGNKVLQEVIEKGSDAIYVQADITEESITREIAEVYLMLATSKIFTGSIVTPDGGYSLLNR